MALVGCGSGQAADGDGGTPDTARVELVMTRSDRDGRLVMSGSYDYRLRQGSVNVKFEGIEDAETDPPTEVRFFGDRFYSKTAWLGNTYWVSDTEESGVGHIDQVVVPFAGGELDPQEALRVILARGKPEALGREDLRGASTTHYRVRLEPMDVSRELKGRPLDVEAGPLAADVWADDTERLRRIRIVEEESTLTYDFFDFGVDVDVERPPSDQVLTPGEFDRMTEENE